MLIDELVTELGPYVEVTTSAGRTFRVQRHYLALHGITDAELHLLGFVEITRAKDR